MNWAFLVLLGSIVITLWIIICYIGKFISGKVAGLLFLLCIPLGLMAIFAVEQGQIQIQDFGDILGILIWSFLFYSIALTVAGLFCRSSRTIYLAGGLSLLLAVFTAWSIGKFVLIWSCIQILIAVILSSANQKEI